MKTTIIALSAAALIAVGPAVLAQTVSSKTPAQQHHVSKKHHRLASGYAPRHTMNTRYPGAGRYVPSEPKDYTYDISRSAGGGGGGGGGGSGM